MCGWATTYAANKERKRVSHLSGGAVQLKMVFFHVFSSTLFLIPPLYFFKTTALGLSQGSTIKVQEKFY